MNAAIIKYNAGNIYSVVHALERLGVSPVVTDDAERIMKSDCVLFPGQGEASMTMANLRKSGLDQVIRNLRQPVLGICIGMQLLCRSSEEGNAECIGIFDVPVKRFSSPSREFKIPHMGWNSLTNMRSPLLKGLAEGSFVYFIHSYYVPSNEHAVATADYIQPFCAAMQKDNFFATQFHPEKSGKAGEIILGNFLDIAESRRIQTPC